MKRNDLLGNICENKFCLIPFECLWGMDVFAMDVFAALFRTTCPSLVMKKVKFTF